MPGPVVGMFLYLHLIIDIYSRETVGWAVYDSESAAFSARFVESAVWAEGCPTRPVILHADNGSPMKFTMERLGMIASFSGPPVSNDNPFSEALFRNCKYVTGWAKTGFSSIAEAQSWVEGFVRWYITEHYHRAIRFATPDARHRVEDRRQLARRAGQAAHATGVR
jgi:putative transposase